MWFPKTPFYCRSPDPTEINNSNAFVRKHHVVAFFFDLEKAYDTTWKHAILSDLHDLGFRGCRTIFIEKILADCQFQVRMGTTLSDIHHQEIAVPQAASYLQLSSVSRSMTLSNLSRTLTVRYL